MARWQGLRESPRIPCESGSGATRPFHRSVPRAPRRYDNEALAQLASLSSAVKCECPRHLAELVTGLSAFERYSKECASRNPRDAALHGYLHATTSQARHLIEAALDQVIEMESIRI